MAILLVLCHHLSSSCLPSNPPVLHYVRSLLYWGWSGVELFFVLSGFLITGILLDTKVADNYFSAFYARRVLRIFPLYYAVLTAVLLLSQMRFCYGLNVALPLPNERPFYFMYLSNWQWTERTNMLGHFWSLAIEEQFYLIWPLVVWLLPQKRVLPLSLSGIVAGAVLRLLLSLNHADMPRVLHGTFTVGMDALLAGAAIACIVRTPQLIQRAKFWIYCAGSIGVLGLVLTAVSSGNLLPTGRRAIWYFSCLDAIYAAVVFHAFHTSNTSTRLQKTLRNPTLVSCGKYSYGIYVYHVPILVVSLLALGARLKIGTNLVNSMFFALAVVVASYLTARVSYTLFEARFLNLKKYFAPQLLSGRTVGKMDDRVASSSAS